MDWIVTGASRGIGAALVRVLAGRASATDRFYVLARDVERLRGFASAAEVIPLQLDLSRVEAARRVGDELATRVAPGATLVHNAGLWPSRRELVDGVEAAFAVNCLGPLAFQAPLLAAGRLARVLVVGAGLMVKGRFDADKTPTGADFSVIRTYCTTKLAGAAAMRDVARAHPQVDFAVIHPGVVNTELGDRRGLLGWLLRLAKRRLESPETCARRLADVLARPRWETTPGEAPWFFEAEVQPWPDVVERDAAAVRAVVRQSLGPGPAPG